jgi:single-strand DNA-binding protein
MIFTITARLGRDAEVKEMQSGDSVANLSLAYNYGKKQDGKRPTQWVEAALWGTRAEKLEQYLLKGQQVVVALTDVHVRTFEKKDGTNGATLHGRVAEIELVGGRQDAEQQEQPERPAAKPAEKPKGDMPSVGDMDDDIPF